MNNIVEICCGSYYDAKQAHISGANRIELNTGLYLGGLTPSIGTLIMIIEEMNIETICMLRPRGAGFCYNQEDTKVMSKDCEILLKTGASGIAFGFLTEDKIIDKIKTYNIVNTIKKYNKQAVFHRAFDCVQNPYESIETLIELGIDRVLTSGLKSKAIDGIELIKDLQSKYGHKIEIIAGSGINPTNAKYILQKTGIHQIHSSCKDFLLDTTTSTDYVSYSYLYDEKSYDVVSKEYVKKLMESVQ